MSAPPPLRPNANGSASWIRDGWNSLDRESREHYGDLLGRAIPYTGSIHPRILELRPGYARVEMDDKPELRNHLGSLHAIALSNLAELTGNAALAYSLAADGRFIVTRLDMRYLKKARGTICGTCACPPSIPNARQQYELEVELTDEVGDLVSQATLYTLVGPIK